MNKKRKNPNKLVLNIILCLCALLFVSINTYHYNLNFNARKQPPSSKWSKEIKISEGDIRTSPKIIKYNDKYAIAHDNGGQLKVIILDNSGKKIVDKTFESGAQIVKNLNLLTDGNNLFLSWTTSSSLSNSLYAIKLDNSLNQIDKTETKGVIETFQVNDNSLIVGLVDKIDFINYKTSKTVSITADNPAMLYASSSSKGNLITYLDSNSDYNFFYVANDSPSKVVKTTLKGDRAPEKYENYAVTSDESNCYILKQYKARGQGDPKLLYITLPLDGKSEATSVISDLDRIDSVTNLVALDTNNESKLYGTIYRRYGKKTIQADIVEFNIDKKGIAINPVFLSRTSSLSIYPYVTKEAAVFCDYVNDSMFNIYFTSSSESIKNTVNGPMDFEKKDALIETVEYLATSFGMLFIYGLAWVIPGLVIISVFSFFTWAMKDKTKKLWYCISYISTAAIKVYIIYQNMYVKNIPAMVAEPFNQIYIGIGVCIFFSVISLLYGYKKYSEDLEAMPAISLFTSLSIDSILSIVLFYPLM